MNRLGNLTLIEYDKNSVASSASFEQKKREAYSKSGVTMTKQLIEYGQWTVAEIRTRQDYLAKTAVKLWSLPY